MRMKLYCVLFILVIIIIDSSLCRTFERSTKTACDCTDFYGACHDVNDEWTEHDTWTFVCATVNNTLFRGCRATPRGNGQLIGPNKNETVNGWWFACESNSARLKYEQEHACHINGHDYHVFETFINGTFEWICLEGGIWITACNYYDTELNITVRLPVAQSRTDGLIEHYCERVHELPARIQYYTRITPESRAKLIASKDINRNIPESLVSFIDAPPQLPQHERAYAYVRMDDTYDVKIRFLEPSPFNRI